MTSRDQDLLMQQMQGTAETIRAFVQQIESGQYGDSWTVENLVTGETAEVDATDEHAAIEAYLEENFTPEVADQINTSDLDASHNGADEPTVDETPISEYPLEVVDERGKEFGVVLTVGGPHIEVVADGLCSARLEGYWGGDRATLHGDYLSTFLDYFIERD